MTASMQTPMWKQRTFYILLLCLFLSLETAGEPHTHTKRNTKASLPSLSQSPAIYYPSQLESDDASSDDDDDSSDITIFLRSTTAIPDLITSIPPINKQSTAQENTASVIASSFRTIEGQPPNAQSNENTVTDVGQRPPGQKKKKPKGCNYIGLGHCLSGLPPMNDSGMPSTPQAVETACRIYNAGIKCIDDWSMKCLNDAMRRELKTSIMGAHEVYSFLCKDAKFRVEYLKHSDCYKKLSPYWDDCSRHFIEGLKSNFSRNNFTALCCIRVEYLTCVSKYSSLLCTLDATRFSMKMAETLIRTSMRSRAHIQEQCAKVYTNSCSTGTTFWSSRSTIYLVLNCFLIIITNIVMFSFKVF